MRVHLATCSPLRSSAYIKYASSLRGCARVDLHPPPAPSPQQKLGGELRFARPHSGFLTPPFRSQHLGSRQRPSAVAMGASGRAKHGKVVASQWGGGAGVRILIRDAEQSDAAHRFPGGVGAIAEGGSVPPRAQTRREEAYFLYADDWSGEHASRRTLLPRLRTGRGHCGRKRGSSREVLRS